MRFDPKTETILTAYAERASGPGWSNQVVWVVVRDKVGNLRQECLLPEEQSRTLLNSYDISEATHKLMQGAALRSALGVLAD